MRHFRADDGVDVKVRASVNEGFECIRVHFRRRSYDGLGAFIASRVRQQGINCHFRLPVRINASRASSFA